MELRGVQAHSLQSEGYLVQLDDRLSSLSNSAGRNLTGLNAEVSRASTWLRDHEVLLRCTFISRRVQLRASKKIKNHVVFSDSLQGNVKPGERAEREAGRGQLDGGSCQPHLQQRHQYSPLQDTRLAGEELVTACSRRKKTCAH